MKMLRNFAGLVLMSMLFMGNAPVIAGNKAKSCMSKNAANHSRGHSSKKGSCAKYGHRGINSKRCAR